MSQVIVYKEGDGIAIIHPTGEMPIEEVIKRDVPAGALATVMNSEDLPDRYFRAAWKFHPANGADVDIDKAKEVQRKHWRKLREPKLVALDIEVMKAVERGDAKRRVAMADKKQQLRDVTDWPLPDDLEEIKATIPDILL